MTRKITNLTTNWFFRRLNLEILFLLQTLETHTKLQKGIDNVESKVSAIRIYVDRWFINDQRRNITPDVESLPNHPSGKKMQFFFRVGLSDKSLRPSAIFPIGKSSLGKSRRIYSAKKTSGPSIYLWSLWDEPLFGISVGFRRSWLKSKARVLTRSPSEKIFLDPNV